MMYSSKSSGTRFDCWNQESWNHSTIEDWNHYHHHHHHSHHHNSSSHYHHHHHHLHHLQHHVQQHSSAISSNISPPHSLSHPHGHSHTHNHLTPLSLTNHSSSPNDTLPRQLHFAGESYSYNNGQTAAAALDESFTPSRIEYCEAYPAVGNPQYPPEYAYYEQPEQCSYSPRPWPANALPSGSLQSSLSPSSSLSHQPQSHASLPHSSLSHPGHPGSLHRPPPPPPGHSHDLLSYHHRYDTATGQSVTNFTNNSISVNVSVNALNIPTLPVPGGDSGAQAQAVASTIQYKIQTQLEKRITITPSINTLKPAGQLSASGQSSNSNSPSIYSRRLPQKSLYSELKHYRIPKRISTREEFPKGLQIESQNSGNNQNMCYICGKNYARPSTLKTHLRTHSGEKPYMCKNCGKAFTQAANLTAHIRTHSGEKPFPCPICKRRFSQSSSVTTHLRIHSGERPYLCNYCRKSFSDSSTLTKHLRIHSGEKPYQCRMCTLKFSQSGNLNRHMRVHS